MADLRIIATKRGKTESGAYVDYSISDGYTYRVWKTSDRAITIVSSPRGGTGTVLYPNGPTLKAWTAVNGQIDARRAGRRAQALNVATGVVSSLIAAIPQRDRRKARPKRKGRGAPVESGPVAIEPEAPSIPWLPLGAGLAAVLVLAMASGSRKAA